MTLRGDRMKDQPISYEDCANALLMMWMENILTDSEYNRIMDRLNAEKDKFDIT